MASGNSFSSFSKLGCYDGSTIDSPSEGNGEFFVFWLDRIEGSDAATHSGGVPNVGIQVADNENRFMVRFASTGEKFGPVLEGDRDFLVIARLWKSSPGADQPYDQLDLWVDPASDAEFNRLSFDHHGLEETPVGVSGGKPVLEAFS